MPQTATGSALPVALARCENYQVQGLEETVGSLLETIGCRLAEHQDSGKTESPCSYAP